MEKKIKAKKIKAKMYKGMESPTVDISEDELTQASGGGGGQTCDHDLTLHVSLESLTTDLHNQSYGMMCGSTGCMSSPNGPGC